ncbi:MAG: hypothetical protein QOG15_2337 [Solirubrobacteraceae bacterium]|jgi:uncharacterized protein YcnI|nr:hypothetical protein [Solirubrobacteraceae bacterium]
MKMAHARRVAGVLVSTIGFTGALVAQAEAHSHVSPSVVQKGHSETFTVVVPTEGTADTASVEVTVPAGFQIGSFEAAPGWKRSVKATGQGDEAVVSKVTWTGGKVPEGEAAYLRFQGEATKSGDYAFKVRQTYSDGKVADWTGAASSDTPAPIVTVKDSLGGGGSSTSSSNTLAVIALVVGILALLIGLAGMARRGGRSLT